MIEASNLFYEKGANPRHIRLALSNALHLHGALTPETILFASHDFCGSADMAATIYSDLWAIKTTSSRSYLPWTTNPPKYPYPPHLNGVIDPATGDIIHSELDKRIKEYEPYGSNV